MPNRTRNVLGIDVGGTKIAFTLADADGRVLAASRRPTEPSGDADKDLARLVEDARRLVAEAGAADSLAGVGLSVPGPLDVERGLLLHPPNLPGWAEVDVCSPLRDALSVPVFLENDANAAALAEWRLGAGRGLRDMVYLTMSTGVGGGLVLGGRIHRGLRAMAGEVGHMPLVWEGELCACGMRGCLEAYVGGASWARRLAVVTPADGRVAAIAAGLPVRPEHVLAAAREGDAFALAEMERFNEYLAHGIATLAFVLAPQAFVLGTIATAAGEALCFEPLRRKVAARLWPELADLQILPSELGPRLAELVGVCVALAGLDPA